MNQDHFKIDWRKKGKIEVQGHLLWDVSCHFLSGFEAPCFPLRCPCLLLSSVKLKFEHQYNFIFLYKLQLYHRLKAAGTNPPGTPQCGVQTGGTQLNHHCGLRSQDKTLSIVKSLRPRWEEKCHKIYL